MAALTIARLTIREAARRKLLLALAVLTVIVIGVGLDPTRARALLYFLLITKQAEPTDTSGVRQAYRPSMPTPAIAKFGSHEPANTGIAPFFPSAPPMAIAA